MYSRYPRIYSRGQTKVPPSSRILHSFLDLIHTLVPHPKPSRVQPIQILLLLQPARTNTLEVILIQSETPQVLLFDSPVRLLRARLLLAALPAQALEHVAYHDAQEDEAVRRCQREERRGDDEVRIFWCGLDRVRVKGDVGVHVRGVELGADRVVDSGGPEEVHERGVGERSYPGDEALVRIEVFG